MDKNSQPTISLSSGESEYYASAIGMCGRTLLEDWGKKYDSAVYGDSSAARGAASRRGLGAMFRLGRCRTARSRIQPTYVRSQ